MNDDNPGFTVKPILDGLCTEFGSSDFGYRMQAVFAHVLMRIGAQITEVNAHGHPDVRAILQGRELRIQVKALTHAYANAYLTLAPEDFAGIEAQGDGEGYLAILDCAIPVTWIIIASDRAQRFVTRPTLVTTLQAERAEPLSSECTDVFLELILEERSRLHQLPFAIVAERALRREPL